MDTVLIDCGSRRLPHLRDGLTALGMNVVTVPLAEASRHREDLASSQALVISGGPRLFTREPALVHQFAFIDDYPGPTLGICLGHQAIGLRAGARIHLGAARRGPERIQVFFEHPLFEGLGSTLTMDTSHREGIDLPARFVGIARSEVYGLEAMANDQRLRYGVQFHPETSGAPGARLLANFVGLARGWYSQTAAMRLPRK